jgi:hypothetical protein
MTREGFKCEFAAILSSETIGYSLFAVADHAAAVQCLSANRILVKDFETFNSPHLCKCRRDIIYTANMMFEFS